MLSFYKLVNKLVPIIDNALMPEKSTSGTLDFRFALANFGANKFNALPNHIKLCQSLKSFKSAIPSLILQLPN